MTPTPTPAPPMPKQARPAPMYFAAVGSMRNSFSRLKRPSVAGMNCIVEIDAGENGEDVGLQERHQELERGEQDHHDEGQRRAEYTENAGAGQHDDESGEDLQRDVAGQHVGEQTNRV